ncbi:acyl-CoA dehydrogenase family protein [Reichenbachiella carrageenanivorans]|uniref:Acyl-CoA dehydrogenase family protein n=1 Tax=Reichenbachiella carrageenanivorans TaxID=2979869 RepID=A0ABY6CX54_9BACT|nr:acyl-CoA dehydrogenase [Reichenbachiella carrageenanivorans]UXX78507.1 acyl-CoA dehydrogenase family protein [Reichenbachiella carrageenanivorans]
MTTDLLASPYFEKNPSLYAFLPMLYMVWADAVLTPSEVVKIRELMESQGWLSSEEREFLLSYLDPKNPPRPRQLKSWLVEIRKTANQLSPEMRNSLVDIGLKLAALNARSQDIDSLDKAREPLTNIEEALGVITSEAAYHLRSANRDTVTGSQSTEQIFDIQQMADLLDGPDKEIIRKVKTVLSDKEFAYIDPDNLSDYREKVLQWCKYLAEQGFGAMAFPQEYGGGGDMRSYFSIMETLSYHDLSMVIKFGVQFGLFGMSIYFLGTKKHHEKYLSLVGSLELSGCFAMTETRHGSNVKGIETTATYNHGNKTFIIHTPHPDACKEYIGNAAVHGEMATVFAKLVIDGVDYGVNAFLVPLRDKNKNTLTGVKIVDCGRKMGLNGVDNGKVWFDQVVIPYDNMLDRFASVSSEGQFESPITSDNRRFFTMLGTLVGGRIGIPRSGLSATKSGLAIAIKYGDKRRQFGPENESEVPILNYRTHQRRLMPLLANSYALHFSLQYLTERFLSRTEDDMQEIEALAAGLKSFTTWHATQALQECREACGGKGYLSENRIDRLKNDTDVYTTFEGDNTVLMQLVAKSRLSEFKKEFSDINLFGILGYIADQAKTSVTELNPITVRNTSKEHLLDFDFHLSAFRYREKEILSAAARRIKKHIDQGMDSFDAFNQTQNHLLNVGFAYVERIILEQFVAQIERTEDAGCKAILTQLCQLFALSQIEKNKGWYLEHDYMAGVKTKAIRREINQLCMQIRENAVPLVEAFKIPDSCLAAPIAMV